MCKSSPLPFAVDEYQAFGTAPIDQDICTQIDLVFVKIRLARKFSISVVHMVPIRRSSPFLRESLNSGGSSGRFI